MKAAVSTFQTVFIKTKDFSIKLKDSGIKHKDRFYKMKTEHPKPIQSSRRNLQIETPCD